jgi:tripartite ATP-independent transporter DctM subunit
MLVLLIFSVLVVMILIGFPIAVAMGLTAVGFFLGLGEPRMIGAMAQRMYSAVSSFPLLAIPFFILAGNLMNSGGMTDRIFGFARTLVGHVRGGLAHVSVLASMVFAGVSGAALAEAMGLGVIEIRAMKNAGIDKTFAGAVVASSSTIGPVIPPSIPMVIYGALAEVSVGKLFLGGVIPGLMMGVGIMIVIYVLSVKRGYRAEQRATLRQVVRSGIDGILGLLAPGIIMGGILGGVFTPTEAAVAAVIYALVVGCLVYRELDVTRLYRILWDTVDQTVRVMFIIAAAGMFGWLLIYIRAPQAIVEALTSLTSSPVVILAILNVILLVLGCFMEGIAIMLLTVPIFMPVLAKFGIDPVHFGVVMTLNLMIGLLTPPVGMVLYAVSTIAQVPVVKLAWELVPFMLVLGVVLILITYIPALVTWLPFLILGGGN